MSTRRNNFSNLVKAGLPMMILMIGGTYALSFFVQNQVDIRDNRNKPISQRKFNLEEEHKAMMKKLDIDNYTLSRIPRPEEANNDKSTNAIKKTDKK